MFESLINFLKRLYGIEDTKTAVASGLVEYLLNDPTTNTAIKLPMPPPTTDLRFSVATTRPPTLSNCCYITVNKSVRHANSVIAKCRQPLTQWAAVRALKVIPIAGKDLNAYYDREGLKFFYAPDPVTKKNVYTAASTDVVAHETGHALLDAIRPDFWDVQSLEIWAFHEAWSDINAIMLLLRFDEIVQYALDQTGGDLRKSNVISRLAEQLALIIYHYQGGKDSPALPSLRDAANGFKYADPTTLPEDGPDDTLLSECHSFGRVFLGAWYEMFCAIYEQEKRSGKSPLDAVHAARDVSYDYLVRAVVQSPNTPYYHDAVARSILAIDKTLGGTYQNTIQQVFRNRNLLRTSYRAKANATSWGTLRTMAGDKGVFIDSGAVKVATIPESQSLKVRDILPRMGMSMLQVNGMNLTDLEISVAADRYYEFDESGRIVHEIIPDPTEVIEHAKKCLQFIRLYSDVGPDYKTMWEVRNNRLTRTLFV